MITSLYIWLEGLLNYFRSPETTDRLTRLASHLIEQQSYYPLMPPCIDVPVDLECWELYGQLPVTPHILIVPSDLRYFVKVISYTRRKLLESSFPIFKFNWPHIQGDSSLIIYHPFHDKECGMMTGRYDVCFLSFLIRESLNPSMWLLGVVKRKYISR